MELLLELDKEGHLLIQEMKKLFVKKYIFILFILVIVFKMVSGLYMLEDTRSVHQGIERNKEKYLKYCSDIGGSFSDQGNKYIEEKRKKYDEVANEFEKIGEDYTYKRANFSEYTNFLLKNAKELEERDVLEIIESQWSYVKESQQNRYFMYYNGWANFFGNLGLDIFLLLLLVCISIPIFEFEIDTQMHRINRIAVNGNGKLYWTKIFLGVMTSVMAAVTIFGIDLLVSEMKFGLGNLNFPIQSIPAFEKCPWNTSIGNVVLFVFGVGIIGTAFFSIIIMLLELLLKDVIYLVIVAAGILFLPILLFSEKQLYRLPIPSSFLSIKGYVTGIFDADTADTWFVTSAEMIKIVLFIMIICAACLMVGYFLYTEKTFKKISFGIIMFCSCILTVGCGEKSKEKNLFIYNRNYGKVIFCDGKYMIDATVFPYKIHTKYKETNLFKDPFGEEDSNISIQGINGEQVYYLKTKEDSEDTFEAHSIHVLTGEDKVLYRSSLKIDDYNYLGLNNSKGNYRMNQGEERGANLPNGFWVEEQNIYLVTDVGIYIVDMQTRKRSVFIKDIYDSNVSYVEGKVIYIDNQRRLNIKATQGSECEKMGEYLVDHCFAIKDKIIFQTIDNEVICYDLNVKKSTSFGKEFNWLKNVNESDMYCVDEKNLVYIYSANNGKLVKKIQNKQMVVDIERGVKTDEVQIIVTGEDGVESVRILK